MASQLLKLNLQFNMSRQPLYHDHLDQQSLPKKVPVTCLGTHMTGSWAAAPNGKCVRDGRRMPLHQPRETTHVTSHDPNCHLSTVVTAHTLNATTPSNSGNGNYQGKECLHKAVFFFFLNNHSKVLIFPLQMWHRIYLTVTQWSHSTIHTTVHSFSARSGANDAVPVYRDSLQTEVHRLTYYCCSLPRGDETGQFPVNPCCPKKIQDWQVTGGGAQPSRDLSGPPTSSGSPGGRGPVSSSSALAWRLSAEFEALSSRRWLASVEGILRPKPRGTGGRAVSIHFLRLHSLHDHSTLAVWQVSPKF